MTSQQVAPQPVQPKNGLGTAGFVLGLIGLVFAFIPVVGVVAWPLVIIGLVLSAVGFARARKGVATNKGMSIAGIACSAIGLVICIVWTAAFGAAVDDLNDAAPGVSDAVISDGAAPGGAAAGAPAAHTVLLEVTAGDRANLEWSSGLDSNHQEVLDKGKTWSHTLSVADLNYTSLSVSPVNVTTGSADSTCKITIDGRTVAEKSNSVAAWCTYLP